MRLKGLLSQVGGAAMVCVLCFLLGVLGLVNNGFGSIWASSLAMHKAV